VAELRGRFGAGHVVEVLAGATTERITQLGHERLGAYGSLREASRPDLRGWLDQLIGQGLIDRSGGDYPTVAVSKRGAQVLRGEAEAGPLSRVARPERSRRGGRAQESAVAGPGDGALFEALRRLRRELADERRVPPYVVFSDATLHELARLRPRTREAFLGVKGVGEWKCAQYGTRFLAAIAAGPA